MMAIMHEAKPYGHLIIARKPATLDDVAPLAMQVAAPIADVRKAILELRDADVFSVGDGGVIFSRRMIRDEERRQRNAQNGKLGGNPKIKQSPTWVVNPPDNGGVNPPDNGVVNPPDNGGVNPPDNGGVKANARASNPIQSRDQRPNQSKPLALLATGRGEMSPAVHFGAWLLDALRVAGIPSPYLDPIAYATMHRQASEALIATFGINECQRRARNMIARKARTDADRLLVDANPATLRDRWDWFETAERPRPGAAPVAETPLQQRYREQAERRLRTAH
jgi:hypothetical protein